MLYPEVSRGQMIQLAYERCAESGQVVPSFIPGVDPENPQGEEGDVRAHLEGYITISPVKPDWNATREETELVRRRLAPLSG